MDSPIRSTSSHDAPQSGFTLIELLVVVAVMGMLILFAEPSLHLFEEQMNIADTTTAYAQMLRRAQALAEAGRSDSNWGVEISTTSVTLYKGTSYASRDTNYDEIYTPTLDITPSGVSEVNFMRLSGLPSTTGTTTLTGDVSSTTVYVSTKGVVTY